MGPDIAENTPATHPLLLPRDNDLIASILKTMELARNVLLLLHLAGMAGILISLLRSRTKIATGLTHSALTALVAGLGLVAIRYPLHSQDAARWPLPDNAKIAIKFTFVLIILALAFANKKKERISSNVWAVIAGLTIGNIIIAVTW